MRILVTGKLQEELQKRMPGDHTFRFFEDGITEEEAQWADAYVGFRPPSYVGNIRWVHALSAGVDIYLYGRQWDEEVVLTRTVCSFGQRIAEYCVSYLLQDLQMHDTFLSQQKQEQWIPHTPRLLHTQTVVVYGTGVIGQELARVLTSFGVTVIGVSASGIKKDGFTKVMTADAVKHELSKVDWVITTLPLTAETERLFNGAIFSSLNGAGFINVGRGKTVDEEALLQALEMGTVRKAILDVFPEEPLPQSPFWGHERVRITPHISAMTMPEEAVACFLTTLAVMEKGDIPQNKVDIKKGY